ncbi:hypothetical protein [Streptosporangium sp. 'caverna']|uniref:hypothetical protein n=1 Tax=Streptosporangium sp. 'caverna' TaxID=2202249 RepID=UPI000D7EA7E7|nr:hypothetical protein [Streptosporangium sp. 'caverna']AWS40088.1 hypothetical protein DKM19_00835 [Streptosporangium sp. 'caverna']
MRPVAKIATGFVFAFGALRFNGLDLLFDPVGWGLCASGLFQLQRSADDLFGRAGFFAVAMVCISLVAMLRLDMNPSYPLMVSSVKHVIGIAGTAGALIAVWLSVEAVIRRIRPCGDISGAALLDVLRWAVAGLGVLGILAEYGYADLGFVPAIAWFAAIVVLIVVLYRSAHLPYLSPTWEPVTS